MAHIVVSSRALRLHAAFIVSILAVSAVAAGCTGVVEEDPTADGALRTGPDGGRPPTATGGAGVISSGGRGTNAGTGGQGTTAGSGGQGTTATSTGGRSVTAGTGGAAMPPPTGDVGEPFLGGFFPIAVDGPRPTDHQGSTDCSSSPATGDYSGWTSCGINTIARGPDCSDQTCPNAFDAQVTAAGLHMIRAPLADAAQDIAKHATDHLLLAWAQLDEPDANGGLAGNMNALRARYSTLTALPGHPPIYLNVGGSDLLVTNQPYQQAFTQADWLANDIYPVAGFLDGSLTRGDLNLVGRPLDKFEQVSPGKPRFAWIESNNMLGQGDPSPGQVRAEIWIAIIHGARGLLYFQEQVEPNFDLLSTTGPVRTEMGKQHAVITQLSVVLQGAVNPSNVGATVTAPLAAGWRQASTGRYFIVVNSSSATRTNENITLTGMFGAQAASVWGESRMVPVTGGRMVDTFAPYAVHIYVIP